MTPPASPMQLIDCASASEDAPISRAMNDSRKIAFLPNVIVALVPLALRFVARGRDRGRPRCGLILAVPPSLAPPGPIRPVTLRRHLSMALPLSKSRSHQIRSLEDPPGRPIAALQRPASLRRQEVDWVRDRQGLHALLGAEVDRLDDAH